MEKYVNMNNLIWKKVLANCICKINQEVTIEEESGNFKTYIVGAF